MLCEKDFMMHGSANDEPIILRIILLRSGANNSVIIFDEAVTVFKDPLAFIFDDITQFRRHVTPRDAGTLKC
jgi:hypothetical protein